MDLEKIKRDVGDLCNNIESTYKDLSDRAEQHKEAERQINELKAEISLLNERKANVIKSVRAEQLLAGEEKKKYTETKIKYRNLIDEERLNYTETIDKIKAEIHLFRASELSLLKSDKDKMTKERDTVKDERDKLVINYASYKEKLKKLYTGT